MAELRFNSVGDGTNYPRQSFVGQTDQSYGFQPAFKLQTGNTRGTQIVGYGGAKIDGANNRIVVTNPADGTSVGMGIIPGSTTNEFGFFTLNSAGQVVEKTINGTRYIYNPTTGKNVLQDGKLPDATYGWAVAADGFNVADGYT